MTMTNMKMSKKDAKAEFSVDAEEGPRFPHGLSIHLNDDSMGKLGFDTLPEVGTEMIIVGVGKVASASESKRQNGIDRDMSIQLEQIEIEPMDDGDDDSAVDAVSRGIKDA